MRSAPLVLGALLVILLGGLALLFRLGRGTPADTRTAAPSGDVAQPSAAAAPRGGGVVAPGEGAEGTVALPPQEQVGTRAAAPGIVAPPRVESVTDEVNGGILATVVGQLRGPDGPVRGGQVRLVARDVPIASGESAADGSFRLQTERTGVSLGLDVRARGFAPYLVPLRALIPGESRNIGAVSLQAARVLDVDVVDEGGRPVAGAMVQLTGSTVGNRFHDSRETDPNGRARFMDAPLGSIRVEAAAPGHGATVVEHDHRPDGQPLRIELSAERHLDFRVLGRGRAPVAGAVVALTGTDAHRASREEKTDTEGRAHFDGLGEDRYDVRVQAAGYRPEARRAQAANSGEVVFELVPWPCLRGHVEAPGEDELPKGMHAYALPAGPRAYLLGVLREDTNQADVDTDGSFAICDLRPGRYVVRVDAEGYAKTVSSQVEVTLDGDASLGRLVLERGGSLHVRVLHAGDPVAHARIEVHAEEPSPAELYNISPAFQAGVVARGESGADGTETVEHLPAGDYWILVRSDDFQVVVAGPYHVSEGIVKEADPVQLAQGTVVSGTVRTKEGAPVGGALLILVGSGTGTPVQVSTDAQGRFRTPALPAGAWRLNVRPMGTLAGTPGTSRDLRLEEGEPQELELVLGS